MIIIIVSPCHYAAMLKNQSIFFCFIFFFYIWISKGKFHSLTMYGWQKKIENPEIYGSCTEYLYYLVIYFEINEHFRKITQKTKRNSLGLEKRLKSLLY